MKIYKYEKFTSKIEKLILEGFLKPGQKLPSVRELKQQYQLSISTIQNGYEYLIIRGLVESIPKSGYYVAHRQEVITEQPSANQHPVVRDATFSRHLELTTSLRTGGNIAEFNVAAPGNLMVPQNLLLRTMQLVVREHGARLLRYYPPHGSEALRSMIIQRAATYQTTINSDELLVTDGALQALYISLASICHAGDVIAVESPCVFSALEVIRVLKLKVIEIPASSRTGFDVDLFRKACISNPIKAVIVTPNFHNPTGVLLSDEQKQTLVSIAQLYGVALIENDIYGDLNFHGTRPSTLRNFDDSGLVLTYSSYAKTLAPGIRLGWLAAGKVTPRAEQIRFALGNTVSPVYQETVSRLLADRSYDRHLRTFRMQLAKNAHETIRLFSEYFSEKTTVVSPAGGYNAWVRMPEGADMKNFYDRCAVIGVRFTPGYTFSFSNDFENCFRVVFADKFSSNRIDAIRQAGLYSH